MADTMHLIDDYVKDDDRCQVKDVGRLYRKAICLGYSSKPINKRKFKQYNGLKSECVDTQFKG